MYKNLMAEMTRRDVTRHQLADALGITFNTVTNKISGRFEFTLAEARTIKCKFFPDIRFEELFEFEKFHNIAI